MGENLDWGREQIPDLTGKVMIVTGGNSGNGYEAVKMFAEKGAEVIMASRNPEKGLAAINEIKDRSARLRVNLMRLDLEDRDSIEQFAYEFNTHYNQLNVLVNNGGISMVPYALTANNVESQWDINYFGHYALTGLLLDTIYKTPNARVVNISSNMHKFANLKYNEDGSLNEDNFLFKDGEGYSPTEAYSRTKLALLLLTKELQDSYFVGDHADKLAVSAHPGGSRTNLFRNPDTVFMWKYIAGLLMYAAGQSAEMGALSTLRAATDPNVKGGDYYGPTHWGDIKGYPELVRASDLAYDDKLSKEVLRIAQATTGITFPRG